VRIIASPVHVNAKLHAIVQMIKATKHYISYRNARWDRSNLARDWGDRLHIRLNRFSNANEPKMVGPVGYCVQSPFAGKYCPPICEWIDIFNYPEGAIYILFPFDGEFAKMQVAHVGSTKIQIYLLE
jgi:hypothetical protein